MKNSDNQKSEKRPILEVKNLVTEIGGKLIHKDLSLSVKSEEIFAIVGGSGTGKTTLLRAILLLQPIVSGQISVFGKNVLTEDIATKQFVRRHWGVLFQQGALFSSLTVLENITFPLREQTQLSSRTILQMAKLKLSMVGLPSDAGYKYPSELSPGMKKRAALARAIVLDPALLFLDEPTAGLDPQGASGLDELILNFKTLGLTIVMITHDLDSLWRVSDRVAFLGEGKVLEVNTMEALYNSSNEVIHNYFNNPRAKAARHIREEVSDSD